MIEDQDLRRLFKDESAEHLARLDDNLLRLEKTPTDAALLEEAFRESHSLKGAARMLGLTRIEATAHDLESILNAARKGGAPLTPEMMAHMNVALADLHLRVREALADGPVPSAPAPPPTAPAPETAVTEAQPSASMAAAPPGPAASTALQAAPPATPGAVPTAVGAPFRIETVRVETRKLDDLLTQVGELSVIQGRAQHRLGLMDALLEHWAALVRNRRNRAAADHPLQPPAEGEAAAQFANLLKEGRDAFFDDNARLESTVNLLVDQVHNIRLVPLSTVFALFPRMVRDLAKDQGKEVELVVEGGDINEDKHILEELKDPLMHLIRNAIDHGIEPPAERERLGKPRCGTLRLSAVRENANVLLVVQDDGRGLDLEAVRQAARKRGLDNEAALVDMNPTQLQQLIFLPGFSTSIFVTELSGRGVGLDVVRVNVERMKGDISLESAPGQGLKVQLRLPLSLTTTRLLLASVGNRLYGLPVEFVHTSRRVREADIFTLEGHCAVLLGDTPVIAARLASLLELPAGKPAAGPETLACIVLQVGGEWLGLLADELLGEEEVVPKPLSAPLRRVRNVSALAILGSGDICAVLNPADLLRSARKMGVPLGEQHETQREAPRPAVLLAEDSALIRAMEKRILEDGGYEVVAAVDGLEALNILNSRVFAAVVSDIVMPNMDGLTLTARIRSDPRNKELPVILVTSLATDEDKRRGLEVGASAYIPKPSFDQRVLLDTLKRLVVT